MNGDRSPRDIIPPFLPPFDPPRDDVGEAFERPIPGTEREEFFPDTEPPPAAPPDLPAPDVGFFPSPGIVVLPLPVPEVVPPVVVSGAGILARAASLGGILGTILIEVLTEIASDVIAQDAAELERQAEAEIAGTRRQIERMRRIGQVATIPEPLPEPAPAPAPQRAPAPVFIPFPDPFPIDPDVVALPLPEATPIEAPEVVVAPLEIPAPRLPEPAQVPAPSTRPAPTRRAAPAAPPRPARLPLPSPTGLPFPSPFFFPLPSVRPRVRPTRRTIPRELIPPQIAPPVPMPPIPLTPVEPIVLPLAQAQPPRTSTRDCQEVKRRRRKKGRCREGFFKELPGKTQFTTWREFDCATGVKITEK